MRILTLIAGALLLVISCSKPDERAQLRDASPEKSCPIKLLDRGQLQAAHAKNELHVPTYWTTDAAWTGYDSLLVNGEFDFALALGLEVGLGIAAQNRKKAAEATAKQVSDWGHLDLSSRVLSDLATIPNWCKRMSGRPVASYAVLFGDNNARLQLLIDFRSKVDAGALPSIAQLVAVSEARPLRGSDSWLGGNGETLRRAIRSTSATIARLAANSERDIASGTNTRVSARCLVGGRESWRGFAVGSRDHSTLGADEHILVTSGTDVSLVFCTDPLIAVQDTRNVVPAR